jgi:putative oxidoreductase
MTKTNKIIYYILLVLVSAGFLMAGYMKLIADPTQIQMFTLANLPLWFMYFIGVCEILGVIGLWLSKTQKWAAWGLQIIMLGAIVVSIIEMGPVGAIIPLIILIVLFFINKFGKKRSTTPVIENSAPASTI